LPAIVKSPAFSLSEVHGLRHGPILFPQFRGLTLVNCSHIKGLCQSNSAWIGWESCPWLGIWVIGKFDEMCSSLLAPSRREIRPVLAVMIMVAHKYLLRSDLECMVRIGMMA